MPAWIIQLIVSLAVRLGLPWVLKRFPFIPAEVQKIIEELVKNLTEHKSEKKVLVSKAKQKISACYGDTCPKN